MRLIICLLTFATLLIETCGAAEDVNSVGYTLPFCEKEVDKRSKEFMGGVCMGMLSMATFMSRFLPADSRFCPPEKITPKQSAMVVIKYAKSHPEQRSENFKKLVLDAMRAEWSCKEK